jgi:hypothetical protein
LEPIYNFDIDLDDEIMKRNLINDEFVYGQDEDEEDGELADFVSEDVSLFGKWPHSKITKNFIGTSKTNLF